MFLLCENGTRQNEGIERRHIIMDSIFSRLFANF